MDVEGPYKIFISNIPYEIEEEDVRIIFHDNVGDVAYVELFYDENLKARGCGILEFATKELAKSAVEKMNNFKV